MDKYFDGYTVDENALQQGPFLTDESAERIPDNSVCRYYGMVQQQLEQLLCVDSYQSPDGVWHDATLKDTYVDVPQLIDQKLRNISPYFCVSIPGQSVWLQADTIASTDPMLAGSGSAKRSRNDSDDDMSDNEQGHVDNGVTVPDVSKRPHLQSAHSRSCTGASQNGHSSNLGQKQPGGCIVYVYGQNRDLKLHDVIEVTGVFSCNPELAAPHFDIMSLFERADLTANHPPTSLVTRLHAITVKKVTPFSLCKHGPNPGFAELRQQIEQLRGSAINVLAASLCGDKLAAEYLLLQLVSRVSNRCSSAALGVLSLNLFTRFGTVSPTSTTGNAPSAVTDGTPGVHTTYAPMCQLQLSPFGAAVKAAVASLVPACVALPLTVTMLNSSRLGPYRENNERVVVTPLQLAPHTQLLLDETEMQQGQLTGIGCANIAALSVLMRNQQIDYDFGVYNLPMPADVPVTILSEGPSMLSSAVDLELPINTAGTSLQNAGVADDSLPAVRAYLHQVQALDFKMDEQSAFWLQQEYLDARKQDRSMTGSDFHKQLTLARLVAISWGEPQMTKDRWHQMKAMEHARQSRLRAAKPNRSSQSVDRIMSAVCG